MKIGDLQRIIFWWFWWLTLLLFTVFFVFEGKWDKLTSVSYPQKISFSWIFSNLSGYTFQFFEKFETNFTETKLIVDAGLATGVANLSKYGKQSCSSMLILSRFSVKFVLQYSTDVENIFYLCGVISGWRNILMKVFCFLLEWESGKFTDARTQQVTFTTCLVIYRSWYIAAGVEYCLFASRYSRTSIQISNQLHTFFFE